MVVDSCKTRIEILAPVEAMGVLPLIAAGPDFVLGTTVMLPESI